MSRKDTILIAVLINAGLLIVLFATALKSNPPEQDLAVNTPPAAPAVAELPLKKNNPAAQGDEVDQMLSQYTNAAPLSSPPSATQPALPLAAAAPVVENVSTFADDLKAITTPAAPVTAVLSNTSAEKFEPRQPQVTVKKGDVLEKIARSNRTTVDELMKLNNLSSTRLKIGQVLRIPSATVQLTAAQTGEQSVKYYTVKVGDNPWTIAVKNHMKVEELLKLNNLNEEKARRLKPGDKLRIR